MGNNKNNSTYQLTPYSGEQILELLNKINSIQNATETTAGLLSAMDKEKLDGIAGGAQVNVIEGVRLGGNALPISDKRVDIPIDDEPKKESTKTVSSGGVYSALESIQQSLVNYYLKTETYSRSEVNALVAAVKQFTYQIAPSLPMPPSAQTMYIVYLVPSKNPKTENVKDEFITVMENGVYKWEQIGSTELSLDDYSTTEEMNAAIASAVALAVSSLESRLEQGDVIPALSEQLHTADASVNLVKVNGDAEGNDRVSDTFGQRSTAGNLSVSDGPAKIDSLTGNTVRQLLENGNFSNGVSGWKTASNTNSTIALVRGKLRMTVASAASSKKHLIFPDFPRYANHHLALHAVVKNHYSAGTISLGVKASNGTTIEAVRTVGNEWESLWLVTDRGASEGESIALFFGNTAEPGVSFDVLCAEAFDLTEEGLDTLLTTPEQCEKFFGQRYIPHGLSSFAPARLTARGYNLFNKADSALVLDGFGIVDGVVAEAEGKKLAMCPIVKSSSNNGYEIETASGAVSQIGFLPFIPVPGDEVDSVSAVSGTHHAFAQNTSLDGYLLMECTSADDICVHFKWSDDREDTYEDYKESVVKMPEGFELRGLSGARDTMDTDGGSIRQVVGSLLGSDLKWSKTADGIFYCSNAPRKFKNGNYRLRCSAYPTYLSEHSTGSNIATLAADNDKMVFVNSGSAAFYVVNSAYTDVADFRAAIADAVFVYELATPAEIALPSGFTGIYQCSDYGTEEFDGAVQLYGGEFKYARDLKNEIRNHIDRHDDEWARKEGVYEGITAGAAYGLVDKDAEGSEQTIGERTAGGGSAIETGMALIKSILGGTRVKNQLITEGSSTTTAVGMTRTKQKHIHTVTGTSTEAGYIELGNLGKPIVVGHKYLLKLIPTKWEVSGGEGSYLYVCLRARTSARVNHETTQLVLTATSAYSSTRCYFSAGVTADIEFTISCFDLTILYGEGKEPVTPEAFFADFPEAMSWEYNAGEFVHDTPSAIKTTGRNLWDEEWEVGNLSTTDGSEMVDTVNIRSSYEKAIPGASYFIKSPKSLLLWWFDAEKHPIQGVIANNGLTQVAPASAYYFRFGTTGAYGGTYNNDICISLSDASFNGQYAPHAESSKALPVRELMVLPTYTDGDLVPEGAARLYQGALYRAKQAISDAAWTASHWNLIRATYVNDLLSAGATADKFGPNGIDINFGVVALDSLTWSLNEAGYFSATKPAMMAATESSSPANARSVPHGEASTSASEKEAYMFFTGTYIRVIDPSYTTLEAFVASLAGQYLIYELATPIRIDFDSPLDLSYKVYEGGMEKAVSEAPMRAVVAYQKDYVKEINKLPQNYQSQESMDSLLLVLGTALGGTFTKSWDGMKWSYTFTPNNS